MKLTFVANAIIAVVFFCVPIGAQDVSDDVFWGNILEQYARLNADNAAKGEQLGHFDDFTRLHDSIAQRLKSRSTFPIFLRKKLRTTDKMDEKFTIAASLGKAFGADSVEDYLFCMGDSETLVRQAAIHYIRKYQIKDLAALVPIGLQSKDLGERRMAFYAIHTLLGEKGLPYYVAGLRDSEPGIVTSAIFWIAESSRQNAVPYLYPLLKEKLASGDAETVRNIVSALRDLYRDFPKEKLPKESNDWPKFLKDDMGIGG
jgi:HEAT repeat protein